MTKPKILARVSVIYVVLPAGGARMAGNEGVAVRMISDLFPFTF